MCSHTNSKQKIDVSICIVSYNTRNLLENCIKSIQQNTHKVSYEIIVVDNDSSDGTQDMLREKFQRIRTVFNVENQGFAKASNQAAQMANGECLLLLNPDTIILNGTVDRCHGFIKTCTGKDIVTCKILGTDGGVQYLFKGENYYFLKAQFLMHFKLERFFSGNPWLRNARLRNFDYDRTQTVGYIAGCFMLMNSAFFKNIGMLDEEFFFYSEDADLCHRARNAGGKIYYFPGAEIIHLGGESSKQNGISAHHHYLGNRFKFYIKNFGYPKALVFRTILVFAAVFRILIQSFRTISDKNYRKGLVMDTHTLMWAMGLKRLSLRILPERKKMVSEVREST